MKFRMAFCLVILFLTKVLTVKAQKENKMPPRPKLVVGIVIDQMRWDYLYRYADRFSEGGFKKLQHKGFQCQQTFINFLPTFTAPGHATIYTGSVPAIHGIAANDWYDSETGKAWYCTEDTVETSVGTDSKAGKMSPRNLLTTTITDELRLATNMRSRTFGIGLKDRGSILPAGHLSNGSFWYDYVSGQFITSSYYRSELPKWLQDFNNRKLAKTYLSQPWELLQDLSQYRHSLPDSNAYEGKSKKETAPVFPHSSNENYTDVRYVPAGNTITFDMAKACLKGEKIGQGDATDFLCISLSATDYAGHRYGPNSLEMEDMYLRLDMEMANFLNHLDKTIGKGKYLLFLTADHGSAHNASYMKDLKIPAGSISESAFLKNLHEFAIENFGGIGAESFIRTVYNYQVFLNDAGIRKAGKSREEIKTKIREWLLLQSGIADVIDLENINKTPLPEPIRNRVVNGYNRRRSGSLQIILDPGWYSGYSSTTGTTHGSWNPYDSHIPLIWYGWKIRKGEDFERREMTDIAATLAALLHIQMPNGCIGKVIAPLLKK